MLILMISISIISIVMLLICIAMLLIFIIMLLVFIVKLLIFIANLLFQVPFVRRSLYALLENCIARALLCLLATTGTHR